MARQPAPHPPPPRRSEGGGDLPLRAAAGRGTRYPAAPCGSSSSEGFDGDGGEGFGRRGRRRRGGILVFSPLRLFLFAFRIFFPSLQVHRALALPFVLPTRRLLQLGSGRLLQLFFFCCIFWLPPLSFYFIPLFTFLVGATVCNDF